MSDTTLIEALDKLGEELGTKIDGLAGRDQVNELDNHVSELGNQVDGLGGQVENLQTTVDQINGYVRTHGEALSGHQQWRVDHDKAHEGQDKDFRSLSSRVSVISGGSGVLAALAMLLQYLKL